jgi:hypothetical protein
VQNFSEVYKLLNKNNLSYKFYNINQFVKSINQSFKQNKNFVKKISNLKKIGSNILNNTLVEINYFL